MTTMCQTPNDWGKKAGQLRADAAGVIQQTSRRTGGSPKPGHCHFQLFEEALPLHDDRAIAFNRAVTSLALDAVLKSTDPVEVAYLGARVVEQTFQVIYRPDASGRPVRNLSVAKHFGTFFTSRNVAQQMVAEIPRRHAPGVLLDPCVGAGSLLCAALLSDKANQFSGLIGVELDVSLSEWASQIVSRVAELVGFRGSISIRAGDGLSYLMSAEALGTARHTDIIINPPYGRMRVTSDFATNTETRLAKGAIREIRGDLVRHSTDLRSQRLFASERGVLEKSRLFFKACAEWAVRGSAVSIISPDSWMSALDAAGLRKQLFNDQLLRRVILISEGDGDFSTVNQATSIAVLQAQQSNEYELLRMNGVISTLGIAKYPDNPIEVGNALPRITGAALALHERLRSKIKFGDQGWIENARGELDQTFHKSIFQKTKSSVPLVRGEHVTRFKFEHASSDKKPSYVDPRAFREFIGGKPKHRHVRVSRIVGRQCSYAQQERRLIFAEVDANVAVGNSCNYLHVIAESKEQREKLHDLLLGVLNSALVDWYFRSLNSNNHVGNYEIDALPFPTEQAWFGVVARLAGLLKQAAGEAKTWQQDLLEAAVFMAYGVTEEAEVEAVLDKVGVGDPARTLNYVRHLARGVRLDLPEAGVRWFNNKTPTLSELDMQMILHVPEGGNWQQIPLTVPSDRLQQIRDMSAERGVVRTTYYGRLRRDQPAYTISTYFNRPGNGTHIHPSENRTLTSREAARLQSFPDRYLFLGSEGAVRKQIGNAVPPLLAKAVGEKLASDSTNRLCVDMFCGAGGLSLGLEEAGWHVLVAVDNDAAALDTYAFNRPTELEPEKPSGSRTAVYRRDLHSSAGFEDCLFRIQQGLHGRSLDLLVGGPPCQGFSHAGYRNPTDERNDLAAVYLRFAEKLKPRVFVLENVEGLATFKGGAVLREIIQTLEALGYRVDNPVWNLGAEQYGVPQMRRRIFVVASRDDSVCVSPPLATFQRCRGRRKEMGGNSDEQLRPCHSVSDALAGLSMPPLDSELIRWIDS